MANVIGSGIARTLVDRDGDPLDDGDGRLKVFLEAADLNIGNVDVVSVPSPLSVTGAGSRSGVLRVTLATDDAALGILGEIEGAVETNEGAISGSEMQVDIVSSATLSVNSHAVTNAGTFAVQSTLQGGTAGIGKLTANSGVDIGDVDVTSIIPGTGATSLGKAEDELHAGGDVGIMALGVRKDSMGNFGDNGDYSPFQLTSDGELRVNIASSVGASEALSTGGTAKSATQRGPVMLVVRNDELAISSAGHIDGDYTHLQVDAQGALYTTHGMTGMVGGANTDIDTSAEQLDGGTDGYDVACKRVDLQASVDNTADILVGDSGVVANGSGGGVRLSPGDFYSIDIDNLTDIWVIAISANQTIIYNYFT